MNNITPSQSMTYWYPFAADVLLCFFFFVVQEELRCRQLELKVKGLSSKVVAAERHRARLETMLKESQRDRDLLKVNL